MLVLTRRVGESFTIGDDITVTVLESRDRRMRIGIEAPKEIHVERTELKEKGGNYGSRSK